MQVVDSNGFLKVRLSGVSDGITIGTTAITSGTVGRVLFEGTGNVVQESSSLFWDATNNRLGIGTETPAHTFQVYRNTSAGYLASFNSGATLNTNASLTVRIENANLPSVQGLSAGAGGFNTIAINPLGGNVLINTTTDAGFRLDVNGTARVSGLNGNMTFSAVGDPSLIINSNTGTLGQLQLKGGAATSWIIGTQDNFLSNALIFRKGATTTMVHTASGNLLINTTTDAGFKLDVNGTARVGSTLTVGSPAGSGLINICRTDNAVMTTISSPDVCIINNAQGSGVRLNTDNVTYLHVRGFASQFAANVTGTLTANAGFTRALLINNIINANANNNELAAIYINPTFNNNIYTGVKNIAIQSTIGGAHFNTTAVNDSAVLQADSTTKGFLPPRMTTTQINAIASPAEGLQVYNTTISHMCFYQSGSWVRINHSPM